MYPVSSRFLDAIGGSHRAVVRVQVLPTSGSVGDAAFIYRPQFGSAPTGGTVLPLLDGDIKLASTADVNGTCDFTISGDYWDVLQPYGAELFVERGVDFGDRTTEWVPCGYYGIEEISQDRAPSGPVRVSGADRSRRLKRNRVLYPIEFPAGTSHKTIFDRLVNGVAAEGEPVKNYAMFLYGVVPMHFTGYDPTTATIGTSLVCEDDAHAFLSKLADAKGCVLRFDRHGELQVSLRSIPPGAEPIYTVQPGVSGNLIGAARKVTRDGVYNVVVARGSDPAAPTGYRLAYNDDDTTAPLYWAGPFGAVIRYYSSPLIQTFDAADAAAETVLSRYKGLPSSLSLLSVPNPALDPLDVVQAQIGTTRANHLVDQVSIPLAGSEPVQIVTRTLNEVTTSDDDASGGGGYPNPVDPGAGSGTGTRAAAAQLILDRLDAGGAILEDWTWTGAPAAVRQFNNELIQLYTQAIGSYTFPDDVASGQVATWLRQYIAGTVGTGVPWPTNFTLTVANRVATAMWTVPAGVDAVEVHEFLFDPANTLKATVAAPGNSRVSGSLAGGREYLYAVRSVKNGQYSPFSDRIRIKTDWTTVNEGGAGTNPPGTGGGGTGGGSTGTTMPAILRLGTGAGLTKVNLGVDYLPGQGPAGKQGTHVDHTLAEIEANLSIPGYADISTGKVRLTSYVGAATTPNSTHSRTEYRELATDGVAKAAWSSTSGDHYVWVRGSVVRKAPGRPHVVLAQIHDGSDDVATIRMEGTTVVATYGDSGRPGTLATGVADGSTHEWMLKTVRSGSNTIIQFFWDDMTTPKATQSYGGGSGNYFKFGNYHQSTTSDDDAGASFVVDLFDSEIWHTGYPEPTSRNSDTSGGGTGGGGGGTGGGTGGTVPVGASTMFTDSFETGNFSRWTSVQTHYYEDSASGYNATSNYSLKIANAGSDHPTVLRTEVHDGDTAVGSHERSELSSFGKSWNDPNNAERWYEFDVRFGDPSWSPGMSSSDDWLIFFQWHQQNDDGSPALAMSVHNDGKVYFEREPDGDMEFIPVWTVRPGVWEHVVVHVKWSPNSSTGFIQAHVNGTEVVPKRSCKTMYSTDYTDPYYVKCGQYRRSNVSGTTVIMHDNIRISGP